MFDIFINTCKGLVHEIRINVPLIRYKRHIPTIPMTGHITNDAYQQELVRVTHYIINNTYYTHLWPKLISKLLPVCNASSWPHAFLHSRFSLNILLGFPPSINAVNTV